MKNIRIAALALMSLVMMTGCNLNKPQSSRETKAVAAQQSVYAKKQPIPYFPWSMERDLVIKLYHTRNENASTHSVWRSDTGIIEGDCPSFGYGIPYDTSLTNPWQATDVDNQGEEWNDRLVAIEQAEPNGIFASKNTNATWVLCVASAGVIEPHYVESKVTVYPGDVHVNYENNRVVRYGDPRVKIPISHGN